MQLFYELNRLCALRSVKGMHAKIVMVEKAAPTRPLHCHSRVLFEVFLAPSPKSVLDLGEGRGRGSNWLTPFDAVGEFRYGIIAEGLNNL